MVAISFFSAFGMESYVIPENFDWTNFSYSYENSIWEIKYDFNLNGNTSKALTGVTLKPDVKSPKRLRAHAVRGYFPKSKQGYGLLG